VLAAMTSKLLTSVAEPIFEVVVVGLHDFVVGSLRVNPQSWVTAGRETQPLGRAHTETRVKLPMSMTTSVQGHVAALDAS
jgi:hypothetical protein